MSDISRMRTNEKFVLNKQQRITENLPLLTMPISLSICLSICLSDCLSVCLPARLSVCLSVCLAVCLPVCCRFLVRLRLLCLRNRVPPAHRVRTIVPCVSIFLNFSFICPLFVPRQPLLDDCWETDRDRRRDKRWSKEQGKDAIVQQGRPIEQRLRQRDRPWQSFIHRGSDPREPPGATDAYDRLYSNFYESLCTSHSATVVPSERTSRRGCDR